MNLQNKELVDLLVQHATEELSEHESRRLMQLLEAEGLTGTDEIELAIAAAYSAFALQESALDEVPEHLTERLMSGADEFFGEAGTSSKVANLQAARERKHKQNLEVPLPANRGSGRAGWAVAAMLLLALIAPHISEQMTGPGSLTEQRTSLISENSDTRVIAWSPPEAAGFENVSGDVVWNDTLQEGYLRLSGMPVNDSESEQYQLWIVDPGRDKHPVDGGVFDINAADGEIVIPIAATLQVNNPSVFAITREKPGGVVVSAGPLLVVASSG